MFQYILKRVEATKLWKSLGHVLQVALTSTQKQGQGNITVNWGSNSQMSLPMGVGPGPLSNTKLLGWRNVIIC